MTYQKTVSNDYPQTIDTTSSPTTVYLRRNVTKIEKTDEMTGGKYTEYHYEEAAITKDEYIAILQAQIADVEETVAEILFGGDE